MFPEQIFPTPSKEFLALMAELPRHLDAAMPLRRQHKRELPGDIRQLSHLLTDERGDLRRDYLADPAALSAYLRYFLPWNIHRLGVLFSGLALDPGGDNPDGAATIVDLGTGPLTAPLTLWMSRPHLRKRPLTFVCVDRAPKPMRLGLAALESMAATRGGLAPWKITLVKGPLDARLRERADLLIMANALNEVLHRGEDEDLLENADALAWHLSTMLTPTGSLCVVEPGIRPSAHLMAALRRGLLHHGLNPVAPCPHTGPCPMSGRGYTAWCHFNFESDSAPAWLRRLSDEARLPKTNVSLEFLLFSARGRKLEAASGKALVRAVSGPFELPGETAKAYGQYACSQHGLTLLRLPRKHLVPAPGALLELDWPEAPETDPKSGALVVPVKGSMASPQAAPTQPTQKDCQKDVQNDAPPATPRSAAPARDDARTSRPPAPRPDERRSGAGNRAQAPRGEGPRGEGRRGEGRRGERRPASARDNNAPVRTPGKPAPPKASDPKPGKGEALTISDLLSDEELRDFRPEMDEDADMQEGSGPESGAQQRPEKDPRQAPRAPRVGNRAENRSAPRSDSRPDNRPGKSPAKSHHGKPAPGKAKGKGRRDA